MPKRTTAGLAVVAPFFLLMACSSSDGSHPITTGSGGSGSGGSVGSSGGATGSGGQPGTGGGSGGDMVGTGGAVATDAGSGGTATDGPADVPAGETAVTDPGTEGDGRFPMMRPAIPPEAAGRLPGVSAGMMRGFQIPAAMGFSGRSGQVYTPAGYVAGKPVAFMVFHDGTSLAGSENIPVVIDNLIFEKKIPMMVAIFIPPVNRSPEYDTVNDKFSQYLTTQALPAVEALGIKLTTDPDASGASGHSSGGILAFTMAWFQPERYRRVLSFSGSYTTLQNPGGDLYNNLVRTTMPLKPIRVAMTAGTNDLLAPRWTMANETMGAALMAAGYHYRYILINGGTHDQASSRPWVAELMTWLWRGYPITGPTQ
jgi:enterochelin esterase-like enzyme